MAERSEALGKQKPNVFSSLKDLKGLKVLVADDSEMARTVFNEYLNRMSFDVTMAQSGHEGVEKILQADNVKPYDLVILDWKMPIMDGAEASRRIRQHSNLKHQPKIILTTAFGREDIKVQAEEYKLDAFLLKPFTAESLVDTIKSVFSPEDKRPHPVPSSPTKIDTRLASLHGAKILLVEDNELNQKIIANMIQKGGMQVALASNGREAVDKVRRGGFDLVLMDIQMPEMDGYEATTEIRRDPALRDLPIIAMTANDTDEDRDKSIQSGMNDHIIKTIPVDEFFASLLNWINVADRSISATNRIKPETVTKTDDECFHSLLKDFNVQDGLARAGNDKALYLSFLQKFKHQYSGAEKKIKADLENGNSKRAKSTAHAIKGAAGTVGAIKVMQAAKQMEIALKFGSGDDQLDRLQAFEEVLNRAFTTIDSIATQQPKSAGRSRSGDADASIDLLLDLLEELKPFIKSRRPIKCKPLIAEILSRQWPEPLSGQVEQLGTAISRYRFEKALGLLSEIETILSNKDKA